jgi:RNA polymerase sigma-54 factor
MSYLQLSAVELEAHLLQEIDRNPALELVDELRCPECGRRLRQLPCPTCAAPRGDGGPIVYLSPREPGFRSADRDEHADPLEPTTPERLDEHVLRQIGPALTRAERPLAAFILAQLDDDGLLREAPAEIAAYCRVSLRQVEHVLGLIHRADPPGVGARSPQECFLLQLDALAERGAAPADMLNLARALITEHFEALGRMDYDRIARRLRQTRGWCLTGGQVEAAARFIQRNLTPFPAQANWGDGKSRPAPEAGVYRSPDVNIVQMGPEAGGCLAVEVFAPLAGWLRVNPELKAAVSDCTGDDRERWSQAVNEAALVTKCLQQRNHTMRRLMQLLAEGQRDFILGGDGDLRATTRVQVAKSLGLHESTISRAVAGKSVALPDGRIIPLAKFFDRSLSVRDRVRNLIEAETRPLTDDEIAAALADEGVKVARRTVAKYRKMLGILPANVRGRQARSTARSAGRAGPVASAPAYGLAS